VPLTATRYSIDALSLPTITKWYPWYYDEEVSPACLLHQIRLTVPSLFRSARRTLANRVCICNGVVLAYCLHCRLVDGARCTRA
jgi:hypothetical protein